MGTVEFYRVKTTVTGTSGGFAVTLHDLLHLFDRDARNGHLGAYGHVRGNKYLRRPVAPYRKPALPQLNGGLSACLVYGVNQFLKPRHIEILRNGQEIPGRAGRMYAGYFDNVKSASAFYAGYMVVDQLIRHKASLFSGEFCACGRIDYPVFHF